MYLYYNSSRWGYLLFKETMFSIGTPAGHKILLYTWKAAVFFFDKKNQTAESTNCTMGCKIL